MTKKPEDPIPLHKSIKTVDGTNEYPIDFVRKSFINSDESIEEIATQLNLPIALVQLHARQGMESWYKLKNDKMLSRRMAFFLSVNIDSLMESHSTLEDGHFLMLAQVKFRQQLLKQHLVKYGHLCAVDDQGEMRKDSYGMPIDLPLGDGQKYFLALESYLRVKEGTKMAMNHLLEENKRGNKQVSDEVIDMEEDPIFKESSD